MARFIPAGYYDLSSLYTSYIGKHKKDLLDSGRPEDEAVRVLELLADGEESGVLKEWRSAQALLHKVGQRLKELPEPMKVRSAFILAFSPGSMSRWHEAETAIHCLLNPSPSFRLYSEEEAIAPAPWMAWVVSGGNVSASNFNAPNTAHELVLETAPDGGGKS